MAQKVQTFLIDDLDGSDAEGTVRFGLDGEQYEIDLSTEHAKELRTALARYIDAGRRVTGTARRAGQNGRKAPASSISNTVWGSINGFWPGRTGGLGSSLSDHFGRLPACTLSAGLPDGAGPAPGVQGRRALGAPARERRAAPPGQPGPLPAS